MLSTTVLAFFCLATTLTGSQVLALDNGLAKTPPMGWISWERFLCNTDCKSHPGECIDQQLYLDMANKMVSDGYKNVGYDRINIDDCWSEKRRNQQQQLIPDRERFPMGIDGLSRVIHRLGLKLGIYGDCGTATCAGYPAQLKSQSNLEDNYFDLDARRLAEWQIDSFKFDGCNIDPNQAESICPKMTKALMQTNRSILLSCEWPFYKLRFGKGNPDYQLVKDSCNLWRYYDDITDSWISILSIVDFTVKMQTDIVKYHGPGGWFDPDQLVIGNFGLSLRQAQAQMAIWSIWSAPLYMSNDLRSIEPDMAEVLKNRKVIAIDQDPMGVFGMMVTEYPDHSVQVFVKPVMPIINSCPSFAIIYLNRRTLGNELMVSFKLRDIITKAPISLAAQRYNEINGSGGVAFNADECKKRLALAMTRERNIVPLVPGAKPLEPKLEETVVKYTVEDLFNDGPTVPIFINSNLEMKVKPSSAWMVKLVEIVQK